MSIYIIKLLCTQEIFWIYKTLIECENRKIDFNYLENNYIFGAQGNCWDSILLRTPFWVNKVAFEKLSSVLKAAIMKHLNVKAFPVIS